MSLVLVGLVGLIVGLGVGWFGRRWVWRFCEHCGGPIGTTCTACQTVSAPVGNKGHRAVDCPQVSGNCPEIIATPVRTSADKRRLPVHAP